MASRQRDCRTSAKSLIASRVESWSAAISRNRANPSPLHVDPSTISRSAPASRSWADGLVSGGSPGHHTVTGRSWMISGVAIADRWRPASPPHVTWIVSAQVSGASGRGMTQCASARASSQDGPSGSADWMTTVREGCRPVSIWTVAAPFSANSGRRATTMRFITLVRAAMWRVVSPSTRTARSWLAQIRESSVSISAMECARADQRSVGSVGGGTNVKVIGSYPAPPASISRKQLVGGVRAPCPRVVVREGGRRPVGPGTDDRVDDAPRLLDLVGPGEQRRVALECVEDERLVRVGRVHAERRPVREVHRHRPDVEPQTRDLGPEAQHDPLVRLDADREQVRVGLDALLLEQSMRDIPVLDCDLGRALRQAFASPDIERHSGPAPVVDRQLRRHERLGLGRRVDLLLVAVTGHLRRGAPAWAVLATDDIAMRARRLRGDGAQDLHLLVAQGVRLERRGRFHRDEADELQEVVLEDVP